MSSSSTASSTSPRVRPVTWAILAWMIIMIAGIVGAWQGSAAKYGSIPTITVASDRNQVTVLPFTATDLDGNTYTNPVSEFVVRGEHTLSVRLPGELTESVMDIYEIRENGVREYTLQAGSHSPLLVPVVTPEEGRIEGFAIRSVPLIFNSAGDETILNGEWSVGFVYED